MNSLDEETITRDEALAFIAAHCDWNPSPTFAKVGDGNAISQSKHRRSRINHRNTELRRCAEPFRRK